MAKAAVGKRKKGTPVRILTAVPICDGHDSPIITINMELARHGAEVIYMGYHCSASAIARAAVQEDVHAIGISSYNGGHIAFFDEVIRQLRQRGGASIPVFGGGGGTITPGDEKIMRRRGVGPIFYAGTKLDEMIETILRAYSRPASLSMKDPGASLARGITLGKKAGTSRRGASGHVVGIAGPGGAGKSTLIDELVLRFLNRFPNGRVAVLANDPSHPDSGGAILGDRATMIYAQHDRVFMRSMATRGHWSGIGEAAPAAIDLLRNSGEFDLILVESVGIGQESDPFRVFGRRRLVDQMMLVMSPFYGGRLQLQKVGLLNGADLVVVNKCDQPAAHTALAEIQERVDLGGGSRRLFATVATRHNDPGVDRLFSAVAQSILPAR